jgi:lysophospholipase L1-like esterase
MRRLSLLAAIAILVSVVPIATVTAAERSENVYVALGDSVAAGTQQPEPFTDNGYTNILYDAVGQRLRLTDFVNFACPADDSFEVISGDDGPNGGSLCYGDDAPLAALMPATGASQLDVAVDYIAQVHDAGGSVGMITFTIGANDLFRCDDFTPECVGAALTGIATNLQGNILPALRAAAPEAEIVAMNYYNSTLATGVVPGQEEAAQASNALLFAANSVLQDSYDAWGVPVADVATAFKIYDDSGPGLPKNVQIACELTLMCVSVDGEWQLADSPDIHPNNTGYARIARAFRRVINAGGGR